MTQLERQIRTAQHRLWTNRWLVTVSWAFAIAAGLFALVVFVQRLYAFEFPLFWIGVGAATCALVASVIWMVAKREDAAVAAATLDEAAGLRERLSSGQYCRQSGDPFAQAVVADAERVSTSLSARQHIRLRFPGPFAYTSVTMLLAALMFLISPGLLTSDEVTVAREQAQELEQAKVAVKRKMDEVRKMTQETPVLQDLTDKLGELDKEAAGQLRRAGDIRHEAIKKIDRLADAVKQKRKSADYDGVKEMRKRLRRLKTPKSANAPTQKLTKALNQGDFKSAKEEVKKLQEQLATLKSEEDKELVAKMTKQLEQLAKQLEELSVDKKLAEQLAKAGVKKKDIDRMLENLSKKDLDQLKKQLEEKGMSQQQIKKFAKQLQQQQQAGNAAKKMAQAMAQSAQAAQAGQMGEAAAGLSGAADQLSELEQLEQEMNQLESAMADLDSARQDLDRPHPG